MKINTFPDQEKSILGSSLLNADCANKAVQMLKTEHFTDPVNSIIFAAIKKVYEQGHSVTKDSVRMQLVHDDNYKKVVDDFVLLTSYAENKNIDLFIDKIKECYHKLRVGECLTRLSKNLNNMHLEEIGEIVQTYLNDNHEKTTFYEEDILSNFEDGLNFLQVIQRNQERYQSGHTISGYSTGFTQLDEAIQGINKGHYIVIGGTPGSGKTTFAVQMVNNLERQGIKVGVLTLELSNNQFVQKLFSTRTKIPFHKFGTGNISNVEYQNIVNEAMPRINEKKKLLCFEEIPIDNISALRSRIRRLIEVENVQVLVIDYISLIDTGEKGSTPTERLTKISICIKDMLKKYRLPGIVLVQLVKNVENTPPDKYHIKDASQIIQDAFEILMLWNPDGNNPSPGCERRKLFVRKARFGQTQELDYMFDGKCFYEQASYHKETEKMINNIYDEFEP